MPSYKVHVKLVKVIPGYFEIEAEDAEEAINIAQTALTAAEMICDETKFYEDIIVDKQKIMRIR